MQKAERDRQWHIWYNSYLESPEWAKRRMLVFRRANGMCEGCGERRAVQVHHTTYEHVGHEPLFELRAICMVCHGLLHPDKDEGED